MEEKHGPVAVDRARGIGALELAAADRIGGGCELDFVTISEADPAFVERIRHARLPHNLVTDLVGAKRLLIFAPRMSHEGLHEPAELLGEGTRNLHRALVSLIEELEAIDWYQQRADACSDPALKAVLLHNRNEEVEHGTMTLEWLRRNDATFDKFLRRYLFKDADIIAIEEAADEAEAGEPPVEKQDRTNDGSLGIRSLRGPV
jgi:ferritin-like protein